MNANSEIRLRKASKLEDSFHQHLEAEKKHFAYQLQQELAVQLRNEKAKLVLQTTASTIAVTVYAVICTVLLLFEHGTVLKTVPDWFVRRAENVRTMWTGLVWLHDWLNLNISGATNKNVGDVISVLISGLLVIGVCVGIGLLLRQSVRNVQDVWRRMNLQQKAVSIALMAAAILVGIVCAEKLTMVPVDVMSWWMLGLAMAYCTLMYN